MKEEGQLQELNESELALVGGAGCRTEFRIRCPIGGGGDCYAEAVVICDF